MGRLVTNKKGQVGLNTGRKVMIALMIMGVLAFALLVALQSLTDTSVAATSGSAGVDNETLTTVTELGEDFATVSIDDITCTLVAVINTTGGAAIDAGNYTQTNCNLLYSGDNNTVTGFNNSDWDVTYTYTFNRIDVINSNISEGVSDFFSNAGTWFALIAIVVIILIIVIVMKSVGGIGLRGREPGL